MKQKKHNNNLFAIILLEKGATVFWKLLV